MDRWLPSLGTQGNLTFARFSRVLFSLNCFFLWSEQNRNAGLRNKGSTVEEISEERRGMGGEEQMLSLIGNFVFCSQNFVLFTRRQEGSVSGSCV